MFDFYYNDDLTAVVGEAEVEITNPKARLRVADRFTVNSAGKIVEQVNHFDPRCNESGLSNKCEEPRINGRHTRQTDERRASVAAKLSVASRAAPRLSARIVRRTT